MSDLVILAIKNLKQRRLSKKLTYKYVRSFRIMNKIESQAYRLLLFSTYRIHNIFHISLLELYYLRDCDEVAKFFI